MMISDKLSKHVGAVKSVLKKWFKNKWHTISAFVGCVIISEQGCVFPVNTIINENIERFNAKAENKYVVHSRSYHS